MASTGFKILCLVLALCIANMPTSWATVYTVGDTGGWALGVDYTTWTSDKTFVVGDSLAFNYDSSHSVAEVSSSDYSACSTANAISSESTGATTVPLKTAGTHYFVCGVSLHCGNGMKLAVTVKPSSTSSATPSTPASSSSGSSSPAGTTNSPGAVNTPLSRVPESSSGTTLMPTMMSSFVATLVGWFGLCVVLVAS